MIDIFVWLLKDHTALSPSDVQISPPPPFLTRLSVFVFQLPSPAHHGLHGSFQRTIQGYDESHRPSHHEDQRHEDGANRDQDDSQEDTLHGEGCANTRTQCKHGCNEIKPLCCLMLFAEISLLLCGFLESTQRLLFFVHITDLYKPISTPLSEIMGLRVSAVRNPRHNMKYTQNIVGETIRHDGGFYSL